MGSAARLEHRVQTPHGSICIPGDNLAFDALAEWRPDWKTELVGECLVRRSGTFVDVGANVGQTLMDYLAAPKNASYVGFEPNRWCVNALGDIIAANSRTDCLVVPVGLSSDNTIRKLFLQKGANADSSASIDASLRPDREWDVQFVPCYKFDDIGSDIGISDISLMKIDVEGAELLALQGMKGTLQKSGHWILCEVLHRDSRVSASDHQQRVDGLSSFLADAGYTVFNVTKSTDERRVAGLAQISDFPNKIWTWDNASECDYMLVPRQDAGVVSRIFGN